MRIQKYDVDFVYLTGKDMVLADTLSRAYLPESLSFGSVEAEIETVKILQHVPISADRIVFWGECVVIPDALRRDITRPLQSSHLGVEGCLRRARECVYWPGIKDLCSRV